MTTKRVKRIADRPNGMTSVHRSWAAACRAAGEGGTVYEGAFAEARAWEVVRLSTGKLGRGREIPARGQS
jgi:hypothetical protein